MSIPVPHEDDIRAWLAALNEPQDEIERVIIVARTHPDTADWLLEESRGGVL